MSASRRHQNPGKRERQAGKRRRRAVMFIGGAVHGPFKVGRRHSGRIWRRVFGEREAMAVADAENSVNGSEESVRQSCLE